MKKYNILIIGDSWGVGEWGGLADEGGTHISGVSHYGTQGYLAQAGHCVINHAKGAQSMRGLCEQLERANRFNYDYDIVLAFLTDPFRDMTTDNSPGSFPMIPKDITLDGLKDYGVEIMDHMYNRMSREATAPVALVGGCVDANPELASKYSNVFCGIESIYTFLTGKKQEMVAFGGWVNNLDAGYTEQFIDDLDKVQQQWVDNMIEFSEHFYPDGAHPNRQAHRMITNYILENLDNWVNTTQR